MGIDKDVDEVDILAISRTDLDKNTVVIPYLPIVKDMEALKQVIKSTPIYRNGQRKTKCL